VLAEQPQQQAVAEGTNKQQQLASNSRYAQQCSPSTAAEDCSTALWQLLEEDNWRQESEQLALARDRTGMTFVGGGMF
jgi:hypothetical protein